MFFLPTAFAETAGFCGAETSGVLLSHPFVFAAGVKYDGISTAGRPNDLLSCFCQLIHDTCSEIVSLSRFKVLTGTALLCKNTRKPTADLLLLPVPCRHQCKTCRLLSPHAISIVLTGGASRSSDACLYGQAFRRTIFVLAHLHQNNKKTCRPMGRHIMIFLCVSIEKARETCLQVPRADWMKVGQSMLFPFHPTLTYITIALKKLSNRWETMLFHLLKK